jgi:hypothetical protein
MNDPTHPQDDYTEFEIREETMDISEFEVIEFDPSDVSEFPILEFDPLNVSEFPIVESDNWPNSVHQNPQPQQ